MVSRVINALTAMSGRVRTVVAAASLAVSLGVVGFLPAGAGAVESATEEHIKTVTTQVSSEGVSIILAVLAGLVALIAAAIIIPKAIGFIKRFV